MHDVHLLCYLFLEISGLAEAGKTVFQPRGLIENTLVDGTRAAEYLKQYANTSARSESRAAAIAKISPLLRAVLIACLSHQLGHVGTAQFHAYDSVTGVMTFFFSVEVDITTSDPRTPKPADVLQKLTRVIFGVESIPDTPPGSRFTFASIDCEFLEFRSSLPIRVLNLKFLDTRFLYLQIPNP